MTRGLDDNNRLSGLAAPQPAVEHRPSISAALSVPISNITKNERGVDNRPAWMSRGFAPNDGPNDFTQGKVFSVNDELSGRGQEGRQLVQEKVQVKHEDSLFRKRCESNMKFMSNTKCIFINMKQHMLCNRESPIYPCNRSILFV